MVRHCFVDGKYLLVSLLTMMAERTLSFLLQWNTSVDGRQGLTQDWTCYAGLYGGWYIQYQGIRGVGAIADTMNGAGNSIN